jgi:integration host factor subunit alpha
MTLTKSHLIKGIHENCGFSKSRSVEVIESVLEIIKASLESGEDVLVSGFGKFCVREKTPRRGRNPANGNSLILDARRVVTFKCSGLLRDKLNRGGSS